MKVLDIFKKKEVTYDIGFSDEKLEKLTYDCESLIEQLEKNEEWDYIRLIKRDQ